MKIVHFDKEFLRPRAVLRLVEHLTLFLITCRQFHQRYMRAFSYECHFGSFFLRMYVKKKLTKRHSYENSAHLT